MFLFFTTHQYSFQYNYDTTFSYIDKRGVLQKEYSQPSILPSPHLRWVVNPMQYDVVIPGIIPRLKIMWKQSFSYWVPFLLVSAFPDTFKLALGFLPIGCRSLIEGSWEIDQLELDQKADVSLRVEQAGLPFCRHLS